MGKTAAFFDVDGTLLPGIHSERVFFQHLLIRGALSPRDLLSPMGLFLTRVMGGWRRVVRADRRYFRGKKHCEIQALARECFERRLSPRIPRRAQEQMEAHRERGEPLILISASLELLLEHFGQHLGAQASRGTRLEVLHGELTGRLNGLSPWGEEKVAVARQLAEVHEIDLRSSFAYANDLSDAYLLSSVGHPVAVNPSRPLRKLARERGWEIVSFLT